MLTLTPARRRGVEILDDPNVDPAIRERSIGDVTRSNRWLGGLRAATREGLDALSHSRSQSPSQNTDSNSLNTAQTLLDVGTGLGDIPTRVGAESAAHGRPIVTIGVDEAYSLLVVARAHLTHVVCANALALPFRDRAIDVVMCSQLLHHFEENDAKDLLVEMTRVARRAVVVSDLRRSWFAAIGFWLVSFVLRFHPVTRHDGVVSVFRGFTAADLRRLVGAAGGTAPVIRHRAGFRLTARWTPRVGEQR